MPTNFQLVVPKHCNNQRVLLQNFHGAHGAVRTAITLVSKLVQFEAFAQRQWSPVNKQHMETLVLSKLRLSLAYQLFQASAKTGREDDVRELLCVILESSDTHTDQISDDVSRPAWS